MYVLLRAILMNDKIMIVNVGIGNVGAVANMLKHIGANCFLSDQPSDLHLCTKVILPGVGAFDAGMNALNNT